MGLDVQIGMLGCEGACCFHLLRGRGDREARRDRVLDSRLAVPASDQRLRLVIAALRRIAQPVGRVAVHHHLAGDHPHAARLGGGEKRVDASRMDGGEGAGCRRPMREKQIEEHLRHARRMSAVGEAGFSRELVAVQPVEQLVAPARDDLDLGKMDMRIDEARYDEMRTMIDHRQSRIGEPRIVPIPMMIPSSTTIAPSSM